MKKKIITMLALALVGLFVLTACGDGEVENGDNGENDEGTAQSEDALGEMQQEEIDMDDFEESDVFLRVNDDEITFAEFEEEFERSKEMAETQYGMDFDDEDAAVMIPQLQQQAVESIITQHVMLQEAEDQDIEVTDEDVEENVEELKVQFDGEEGLEQAMEAEGLTDDSLREFLYENLMIENLMSRNLDLDNIEVTEEEKEAYYAQLQESWEEQGQEEVPYEDVEDQITEQLQQQQIQEKQMEYVEELMAEADIDRLYQ
ncbi:SurA N-terminal domain-containing protein [Isachenkonia alkalipeptolytica]|uniref:SurA N-terminal domain-containing protein n=1 Tax=Isachenkonia alkalipeptolytica TaxID=2565777 RepID=UPI00136B876E|nr:SurA N-terminal domain-containing protein [Isachenkonia alkalipeptolytica]